MKKTIQVGLTLTIILLFASCAQSYHAINPSRIAYNVTHTQEEVSVEYRYGVLKERGNKKMSKKEEKHFVKLVAVKITNNTDKIVNIGQNAAFYSGNSALIPLEAEVTKHMVKQSVPSHLFYLFLSPLTLSINGSTPFPIGLIIGPAITAGNMLLASNANNKLYHELLEYDILNRNIQPGETVFGLVGFRNLDFAHLSVKIIK